MKNDILVVASDDRKSEIRNPKSEHEKPQITNSKSENGKHEIRKTESMKAGKHEITSWKCGIRPLALRVSDFEFVSNFGFGFSDC